MIGEAKGLPKKPLDDPHTCQFEPEVLMILINCETAAVSTVTLTVAVLLWPDMSIGVVAVEL